MSLTQQSAICCRDPLFRAFLRQHGLLKDTAETAAIAVRLACGVTSRRDIAPHTTAGDKWRDLHAQFVAWRDYPEICGMRAMARRIGASVAVMLAAAAVIGAVLWATPASAIDCQATKGAHGYWSWREIGGKRCWYLGYRGMDKRSLQWPAEAARARVGAIRAPEASHRPPRPETQPAATPGPMVAEAGAVLAPVTTRWPEVDLPPIDSAAAVTAPGPLRLVPSGTSEPATSDRRHQPVPPPAERSPALTVTMLLVALAMVAAGAVLIRPNTKHEALR